MSEYSTEATALPARLYHGTRASRLQNVLETGLSPRAATGHSNWEHSVASRSDAVYLTTAYPLHFAISAGTGDLVIFEVATNALEVSALCADEDALAHAPPDPDFKARSLESRTRYYRERAHLYPAQYSLSKLGTCAHLGVVPRAALVRMARIRASDIEYLVLGGFDPVISPLNYMYCGAEYEQSVPWLFGDTPVCALNPRLERPAIEVTDLRLPV